MEMKPAGGTSSLFVQSSHHRTHSVNCIENFEEVTFSSKAISVTSSVHLRLVFLSVFMMPSFMFYVVFKSSVSQDFFCELQKGQSKPIYLSFWTASTFWICRKIHSPGSTIFVQNTCDLLARLNAAAEAFQAVPCKHPLPT